MIITDVLFLYVMVVTGDAGRLLVLVVLSLKRRTVLIAYCQFNRRGKLTLALTPSLNPKTNGSQLIHRLTRPQTLELVRVEVKATVMNEVKFRVRT